MNNNLNPMPGQQVQNPVNNEQNQNSNKNSDKRKLVIIIILTLLVLLGIVGVILYINSQKETPETIETEEKENTLNDTSETEQTDEDGEFLMNIEDVFSVSGQGTTVTGTIERGKITEGDTIQVIGLDNEIKTTIVVSIQMFREERDSAVAGESVGIVLKDLNKEDVKRGQVLAAPNSISSVKKFEAEVSFLTTEEGGGTSPISESEKLNFYFGIMDITGSIDISNDTNQIMPGDDVTFNVELDLYAALEVGSEFSVRGETGNILGSGKVTKLN